MLTVDGRASANSSKCTRFCSLKHIAHWIAREHLKRNHSLSFMCPRCHETFNQQNELDNHLIDLDTNGCEVLGQPLPKGITPGVMAMIMKRGDMKGRKPTDEQRWFEIYQLIFPEDPTPISACKIRLSNNLHSRS